MLNNFVPPAGTNHIKDLGGGEYEKGVILKAVDDCEKIIGSVRAYGGHETVHIGKLIVHPEYQKKGIGTALLREIEAVCLSTRYELFTSDKSQNNLRLYRKLGYQCFKEQEISPILRFVYLEKNNTYID